MPSGRARDRVIGAITTRLGSVRRPIWTGVNSWLWLMVAPWGCFWYPWETMDAKHTNAQVGTDLCPGTRMDTNEGGCPMSLLIGLLAGRWAFPVLYQLLRAQGPIRFGQLQRAVGRVTQKELTR